jgi:hypothetical protein
MIDIQNEQVISLTQGTKVLPGRRGGKRPHVATLYRWAQRGHRGVVLETIQIGGTKCTSVEALQRFFNRLRGVNTTDTMGGSKNLRAVEKALEAEGL